MTSSLDEIPSFFGFKLFTHRVIKGGGGVDFLLLAAKNATKNHDHHYYDSSSSSTSSGTTTFQFEALIAAISIVFFRSTVHSSMEPFLVRWLFCMVLAILAYWRKDSYDLIVAVEIFSYTAPYVILGATTRMPPYYYYFMNTASSNTKVTTTSPANNQQRFILLLIRMISVAGTAVGSLLLSHVVLTGKMNQFIRVLAPLLIKKILHYLFPIREIQTVYSIIASFFQDPTILHQQFSHLFFVTAHIQMGIGFVGIHFLMQEQSRRNELIQMDGPAVTAAEATLSNINNASSNTSGMNNSNNSSDAGLVNSSGMNNDKESKFRIVKAERAKKFQRGAAPFILFTALPYMLKIIIFGNINKFAYMCVEHELHRTIRLTELFHHDNHLLAIATQTATSPQAFADSISTVTSIVYELFNRKLFSLPKILLLPSVMSRQPLLIMQVFPFIFASDWMTATVVSFLTKKMESLRREVMDINAIRSKVEAFDIKNAELLQRSGPGSTQFTQRRWEELTIKIQSREALADLISRSKEFFSWMHRNFVFGVLIDCALASLMAVGKIVSAEIFVFSRAIEDAVDMVLMRSRSEAQLAQMLTEAGKLKNLADLWERSKDRTLLRCGLAPPEHKRLVLRNLHYSRGTASARVDHFELSAGVYALTGSNGSGKSTLFRVLMSCTSNERSIDLPSSINLHTPMDSLTEHDNSNRDFLCVDGSDDTNNQDDDSCSAAIAGQSSSKPHHIPKLSITMPSSNAVEISQTFYWPLYTKPIDWIYQEHLSELYNATELDHHARKIAEHLHSLEFFKSASNSDNEPNATEKVKAQEQVRETVFTDRIEAVISHIKKQLTEEKEDWFGELSGGQKSKVELVRKVFLKQGCPDLLLIDETMAPLDPTSKLLVMTKLKDFCRHSIVIVIYHTDVGRAKEGAEGETTECVPSNDFFDKNIHLEHGLITLRDTC